MQQWKSAGKRETNLTVLEDHPAMLESKSQCNIMDNYLRIIIMNITSVTLVQ